MKRRGVLAALLVAFAAKFETLKAEFWKPIIIDIPYRPKRRVLTNCRTEDSKGHVLCDPVELKHVVLVVRHGADEVSMTGEEIMRALKRG